MSSKSASSESNGVGILSCANLACVASEVGGQLQKSLVMVLAMEAVQRLDGHRPTFRARNGATSCQRQHQQECRSGKGPHGRFPRAVEIRVSGNVYSRQSPTLPLTENKGILRRTD